MTQALGESQCSDEELRQLNGLLRLSRLSFDENELPELCRDIRGIRELLSRVRKFKDLRVEPLYNVWDQRLQPPDFVDDRQVSVTWLDERSGRDGMIRVPWRGG